jgi:putative transposase
MTRPRIVDPGATLALSRRTTRRHFLLHPDEARHMEQVYWYCLAYAAKLHGVLVHAACLMSTHCHEVITDVRGEYPNGRHRSGEALACIQGAVRAGACGVDRRRP